MISILRLECCCLIGAVSQCTVCINVDAKGSNGLVCEMNVMSVRSECHIIINQRDIQSMYHQK